MVEVVVRILVRSAPGAEVSEAQKPRTRHSLYLEEGCYGLRPQLGEPPYPNRPCLTPHFHTGSSSLLRHNTDPWHYLHRVHRDRDTVALIGAVRDTRVFILQATQALSMRKPSVEPNTSKRAHKGIVKGSRGGFVRISLAEY
jgi:hypothetical protein